MHNRNPILSFLLSLLVSGLGQVYNGELKKGAFLLLLGPFIYLMLGLLGWYSSFYGLVAGLLVIFAYKLYVCIEAAIRSKRLNPYALQYVNKIWVYVLFAVSGYGITEGATMFLKNWLGYETFRLPSTSMEPTVHAGDMLMATKIHPDELQPGDFITFIREDGQKYCSRVLGLPGQQLTIKDDRVMYADQEEKWVATRMSHDRVFSCQEFVSELPNGRKFSVKTILQYNGKEVPKPDIANVATFVVPADKVFLVGDNRDNSMDSRTYGAVDLSRIDKKINYVYWGETLDRIGVVLDK